MELRQLRYFVAVARNESFKKAAIELRIAQPALSRQITLLEHEMKAPLFTRHARGSAPTEEGRMLLDYAEQILRLTDEARQALLFHHSAVSGPVGIGLSSTLAEWIAADLMERVQNDFPEVTLSFFEGMTPRLRQMLVEGAVDIAVLSLGVDPTYLTLGTSFCEPISLVGQAGDPLLQSDQPLRIEELVALPLILAGLRKEGVRAAVDRALAEAHLRLENVVAEVETVFMARPMVARGLGCTISIESAAEQGISDGTLAARPIQGLRLDRVVARSSAHSPSRAVLEVSKLLGELLRERFPPAR